MGFLLLGPPQLPTFALRVFSSRISSSLNSDSDAYCPALNSQYSLGAFILRLEIHLLTFKLVFSLYRSCFPAFDCLTAFNITCIRGSILHLYYPNLNSILVVPFDQFSIRSSRVGSESLFAGSLHYEKQQLTSPISDSRGIRLSSYNLIGGRDWLELMYKSKASK